MERITDHFKKAAEAVKKRLTEATTVPETLVSQHAQGKITTAEYVEMINQMTDQTRLEIEFNQALRDYNLDPGEVPPYKIPQDWQIIMATPKNRLRELGFRK